MTCDTFLNSLVTSMDSLCLRPTRRCYKPVNQSPLIFVLPGTFPCSHDSSILAYDIEGISQWTHFPRSVSDSHRPCMDPDCSKLCHWRVFSSFKCVALNRRVISLLTENAYFLREARGGYSTAPCGLETGGHDHATNHFLSANELMMFSHPSL